MDRSGLVALVCAAAVAYGAAVGIARVGLDDATPLTSSVPDRPWSRPPPPEVYPLDDANIDPVPMHEVKGSLHYLRAP